MMPGARCGQHRAMGPCPSRFNLATLRIWHKLGAIGVCLSRSTFRGSIDLNSGGWTMKSLAMVLCGLLLGLGAMAQDHAAHMQSHPVALVSGLGDLRHPVSTKNAEAQKFFDQGLRFIYAFNHDEAARSFQHAAELDPKLAIAYWGVAEAVGPNYNDPASADRFKAAHEAIQKAADLSANASPSEQAYIQAMAK